MSLPKIVPTGIPRTFGGVKATGKVKKEGSLLDRIRAKEAARKAERDPAAVLRRNQAFIRSKIPQLRDICLELAQVRQSYALPELVDRITTSIRDRLDPTEIVQVLIYLAETEPDLCSITKSNQVTVVRLYDPLALLPTRRQIQPSAVA